MLDSKIYVPLDKLIEETLKKEYLPNNLKDVIKGIENIKYRIYYSKGRGKYEKAND